MKILDPWPQTKDIELSVMQLPDGRYTVFVNGSLDKKQLDLLLAKLNQGHSLREIKAEVLDAR